MFMHQQWTPSHGLVRFWYYSRRRTWMHMTASTPEQLSQGIAKDPLLATSQQGAVYHITLYTQPHNHPEWGLSPGAQVRCVHVHVSQTKVGTMRGKVRLLVWITQGRHSTVVYVYCVASAGVLLHDHMYVSSTGLYWSKQSSHQHQPDSQINIPVGTGFNKITRLRFSISTISLWLHPPYEEVISLPLQFQIYIFIPDFPGPIPSTLQLFKFQHRVLGALLLIANIIGNGCSHLLD